MKTVLVVSYFYPPFDTTAAVEASKFSRYLPEYDWLPVILTANSHYPQSLPVESDAAVRRTRQFDVNGLAKRFLPKGGSPVDYVPDDRRVLKRGLSLVESAYRQTINFPDGAVGWFPFAVREGRKLIAEHRPQLIFSIAGPFTSHLVSRKLAAETQTPWFADFRDLWTDNHYFRRARPLLNVERSLERRTMRLASGLSAPTPAWVDALQEKFAKRTWLIPNGFDTADLPSDVRRPSRFTLTYTGVFYRKSQSPDPLLDALAELHNDKTIDASNFELRLVGRYLRSLHRNVAARGIGDLVSFHDTVSHHQALRLQAESTALLFFLWVKPEGRGWLSAKVYEYMASRRPILALGPGDVDAAMLVASMRAGEVATDRHAIVHILRRWIAEFRADGYLKDRVDTERLKDYEWKAIGGRLAGAFNEIAAS